MKKVLNNRGETLVEILVSLVLFMMLLAVLMGAVKFAGNAQIKAEELRNKVCEYQLDARTGAPVGNEVAEYNFNAISIDGSEVGDEILFTVEVILKSVEAEADGSRTDFRVFGSNRAPGGD